MKQNKNSPWTKLNIKLDLQSCLTRRVIFEKYIPEVAREIEMENFFLSKIDNCELFINKNYPDSFFCIKENNVGEMEILFEKDDKNKCFFVKYRGFWKEFETKYGMQYNEIQLFTKDKFEAILKSEGYKTSYIASLHSLSENLLKSEGYKTSYIASLHSLFENLLKSEGYKTEQYSFIYPQICC